MGFEHERGCGFWQFPPFQIVVGLGNPQHHVGAKYNVSDGTQISCDIVQCMPGPRCQFLWCCFLSYGGINSTVLTLMAHIQFMKALSNHGKHLIASGLYATCFNINGFAHTNSEVVCVCLYLPFLHVYVCMCACVRVCARVCVRVCARVTSSSCCSSLSYLVIMSHW